MRLSIIVPAFNEEAYILDCLYHILEEIRLCSCPSEVEVLVVDNASTDATPRLANVYDVRVVKEPNKGLTKARQAGLEASYGEVVGYVDADTRMPPGWIDKVLEGFQDSDVVCMSGPYIYYDATLVQRALVRSFFYVGKATYWVTRYMAIGGNFAARRSALEKIGGFDTEIDFYGEDTDIARRLCAVGKVKFTFDLPMPTSARRMHGEGIVTMGRKYLVNFLSEVILKRPVTQVYKDFR